MNIELSAKAKQNFAFYIPVEREAKRLKKANVSLVFCGNSNSFCIYFFPPLPLTDGMSFTFCAQSWNITASFSCKDIALPAESW